MDCDLVIHGDGHFKNHSGHEGRRDGGAGFGCWVGVQAMCPKSIWSADIMDGMNGMAQANIQILSIL